MKLQTRLTALVTYSLTLSTICVQIRKHKTAVAQRTLHHVQATLSMPFPHYFANDHPRRRLDEAHVGAEPPIRILYVITTLAEYNSGTRSTVAGSDRLQETLIPTLTESVHSLGRAGYLVDVYLVCHFTLSPERHALIQAALPEHVGLQVWNDASPVGYDTGKTPFVKVAAKTLQLARQHRFVLKDKLAYYDHFLCFEDDMIIHAAHVTHWRAVTNELRRLEVGAPTDLSTLTTGSAAEQLYHGTMTQGMLARLIPGLMRVEVLLDEANYPAQSSTGPVPVEMAFDDQQRTVDPTFCCHVEHANDHIPAAPTSDQLMLWETNIVALGVRRMPEGSWLDWVTLLRGPNQQKLNVSQVVGDYWSNRHGDYYPKTPRPIPTDFKYINNMGGWMMTQPQLWRLHNELCAGSFLPPFDVPHYQYDGLDMRNVEWYSGGMQLSTVRHACNLFRVIDLAPANFSKALIYHSANNKQRQLAKEGKRESFTKVNTLLGQLNAVRKRARAEMMGTA